ncbi:MAG: histidinol-phosphate phosphatase family protein [Parcubacteria group bacterium Gr01-1014_70]|nr:MAG: histidinol-phosphate phosphatase family protein [Parcubacteria group bacterium Gr01-1014_70]
MKAVILAGGKGTRLGSLTADMPKPLIAVGGKSILEHQILLLKKYGITDIIILTGHLGDQIARYVGDGSRWGVSITYIQESESQGTAGALRALPERIKEDFLLLSGDVMAHFNVQRFLNWHNSRTQAVATVIVHPSNHPMDSDLVEVDADMKIINLLRRPHSPELLFRNLGIASMYIMTPAFFSYIPQYGKCDIERDVFPRVLVGSGALYAYQTPEYLRDMGTPDRLGRVRKDYSAGTIAAQSFETKRPAIFLDRDGVINKGGNGVTRLEDMELYEEAKQAICRINSSLFLSIVVTNQPVLAKGLLSEEGLYQIHKKMETELGKAGAAVDAIYYCPHHPKRGFEGEIAELKIICGCRKPEIGLLTRATEEFNIDLTRSVFIGDSTADAKAAENAGIRFIGVKTGNGLQDGTYELAHTPHVVPTIADAVDQVLML